MALLSRFPSIVNSLPQDPGDRAFEKIVVKEENAGNQQFFFSHNVFRVIQNKFCHLDYFEFVVWKCFEFRLV